MMKPGWTCLKPCKDAVAAYLRQSLSLVGHLDFMSSQQVYVLFSDGLELSENKFGVNPLFINTSLSDYYGSTQKMKTNAERNSCMSVNISGVHTSLALNTNLLVLGLLAL